MHHAKQHIHGFHLGQPGVGKLAYHMYCGEFNLNLNANALLHRCHKTAVYVLDGIGGLSVNSYYTHVTLLVIPALPTALTSKDQRAPVQMSLMPRFSIELGRPPYTAHNTHRTNQNSPCGGKTKSWCTVYSKGSTSLS